MKLSKSQLNLITKENTMEQDDTLTEILDEMESLEFDSEELEMLNSIED